MRNVLINTLLATLCILIIGAVTVYVITYVNKEIDNSNQSKQEKPISYPEEIQAVRAGDTLYVSSVSDSIYIGFKPLNK
jgi:hypothetical protein